MGLWGIIKANFKSIGRQKDLEQAFSIGDSATVNRIIAESISDILKAGLTKQRLRVLEAIRNNDPGGLSARLSAAFMHGWKRSETPNLSNAMDEVLREAEKAVKESSLL